MLLTSVGLLAIMVTALYLVPVGAHFFEMARKISLSPSEYMTVQKIYMGWSFFGIVIFAVLLLTLIHTFMARGTRIASLLSFIAFLCLAATQVIFWMFIYPINVASTNWTVTPSDFEAARQQWGNSRAVNAVLTFVGLAAIAVSVVIIAKRASR